MYQRLSCNLILLTALASQAYALDTFKNRNIEAKSYSSYKLGNYGISGLLLGELIYSNYNQATTRFADNSDYSTLCFPRANVYLYGDLNKNIAAKMAFNFRSSCGFGAKNDETNSRKFDKVDEVFVTLQDQVIPLFAKIGIQYLPFGDYPRNKIPANLPQLLTQTQDGAVVVGYRNNNFELQLFTFNGKNPLSSVQRIRNSGVSIGFMHKYNAIEFRGYFDWMQNIAGGVNHLVSGCGSQNSLKNGYRKTVDGYAMSLSIKYRDSLAFKLRSMQAARRFAIDDIKWLQTGAKPSALSLSLEYPLQFKLPIYVSGSWQKSWQALNVKGNDAGNGLPKQRIQLDLGMKSKYNELVLHCILDDDYNVAQGGTGRNSIAVLLSLKTYLF